MTTQEFAVNGIAPAVRRIALDSPDSMYVYDLERLRRRCRLISELRVGPKRAFFATMANDHPDVLACVRDCGLGVFVNSGYHLDLTLGLGFSPDRIIYAASNMTLDQLANCVRLGVHLVLDSVGQLRSLCSVLAHRLSANASVEIGVRVNVGSALDRTELRLDPSYRFGLVESELPTAVAIARHGGARIVGLHSYFGTDVMRPAVLLRGLEMLVRAARHLPDLRYLDVGGGFGVPEDLGAPEFDLAGYQRGAAAILESGRRSTSRPVELYIEPGRYLAADCGYYFVKVVDVKMRADRVFVGTNGSVAEFPRPLLYPDRARHPCQIASPTTSTAAHELPIFVCGNTTYSQDFLARGIALPLPQPGDTLVLHYAGAYGRSMATRFLGRRMPAEVVVDSIAGGVSSGPRGLEQFTDPVAVATAAEVPLEVSA
jgi:diaminopimelate decarboxylase